MRQGRASRECGPWRQLGRFHAAPFGGQTHSPYYASILEAKDLAVGHASGSSLLGTSRFTLLVTREEAAADAALVAKTADETQIPLHVVTVATESARALYGADFALIRPDQYIAWRGDSAPAACAALSVAAGRSTIA